MADVLGTEGADTLYGTEQADTVLGLGGGDRIVTGGGADSVDAGAGDDEVNGYLVDAATGSYSYWLSGGAKQVAGGAGNDFVFGGSADDRLDGGTGDDRLYGHAGQDGLQGADGDDWLDGGDGADTLDGGTGADTLYGGAGNDQLDGGAGADRLYGGDGDDHYRVDDLGDQIVDSGGDDTVVVTVDGYKLPEGIEHVVYADDARPLPYWLDALVPASGSGLGDRSLLDGAPTPTYAYCFPATLPDHLLGRDDAVGFVPFNAAQIARVREALAVFSGVCNVAFVETSDPSALNTLVFANNHQTGTSGYAWFPSTSALGSDVFLNVDDAANLTMADGSFALLTLVHEIGHALGLKHPFDDGGEGPWLGAVEDATAWTVMSYNASPAEFALRLSPLDVAALQYLYGPSLSARTGDDRYLLSETASNLLWDGAGHDLVDASAASQGVVLHLDAGYWDHVGAAAADRITAAGQLTIGFGSAIEDALGSAHDDQLSGNALANQLSGGGGDDTLRGSAGDDRLDGGAGSDTAVYADARAAYQLDTDPGTGLLRVRALQGDEGSDLLSGIEQLQFADGTVTLASGAARTVAVTVQHGPASTPLAGVALQVGTQTASTGDDGQASLAGVSSALGGAVAVSAQLPVSGAAAQAAADAAVNLQDAIAVLRMVVGLDDAASGHGWTGLQARAADFDGDGGVGLGDAIGVLRHVVGLDAPAPQWRFLDAADPTLGAPASLAPGPLPALSVDLADPADPLSLQLLGVLSGDVDGSLLWPMATPATGP